MGFGVKRNGARPKATCQLVGRKEAHKDGTHGQEKNRQQTFANNGGKIPDLFISKLKNMPYMEGSLIQMKTKEHVAARFRNLPI